MSYKYFHFLGICGVGMGSLAIALAKIGHKVSGSDNAFYEPMKSELLKANIELFNGFKIETAQKLNPNVVIIGNVVRKDNEEAIFWLKRKVRFHSFPEAIRRYVIKNKKSIVCSGTHGKTTTSSWCAYLLKESGKNPSYLIGGVPINLDCGVGISDGDFFVGEGDEYDSAFFDKGPKFLHYNPHNLIISNIEFDHADIYSDLNQIKNAFLKLVSLLPGDGLLIANADDANIMELLPNAFCRIQTYGNGKNSMWQISKIIENGNGFEFEVSYKGKKIGLFNTSLMGRHNLNNILSGIICGANIGIPTQTIREILREFKGVRRRQEIVLASPVVIIDDFAHHPTEVKATLEAVRSRYSERRIWALFEPRSATARTSHHQKEYSESFDKADMIIVAEPYKANTPVNTEPFSSKLLAEDLKSRGKCAYVGINSEEIISLIAKEHSSGDVIVVMSNGEFDKIQSRLASIFA